MQELPSDASTRGLQVPSSTSSESALLTRGFSDLGVDGLPARVLVSFDCYETQRVLYAMASEFPNLFELFLLDLMSPAAAYLLTNHLENASAVGIQKEDEGSGSGPQVGKQSEAFALASNDFYAKFYGAVEDQQRVLNRLVDGRERLARLVCTGIVSGILGNM